MPHVDYIGKVIIYRREEGSFALERPEKIIHLTRSIRGTDIVKCYYGANYMC